MWTIIRVFVEFVIIMLLSSVLIFWPCEMWGSNLYPLHWKTKCQPLDCQGGPYMVC